MGGKIFVDKSLGTEEITLIKLAYLSGSSWNFFFFTYNL